MGYSIKTGLLEEGICGAETSAEIPMWRQLAPSLTRGVLYVLDLGFFERQLFVDALAAGAHVLMRLKSNVKVRVVGHLYGRTLVALPDWSPRPATAESRRPCTARRPRAPRPPVQQQRNLGAHAPLADPARRGLPCRGLLAWPTLRKWVSPARAHLGGVGVLEISPVAIENASRAGPTDSVVRWEWSTESLHDLGGPAL